MKWTSQVELFLLGKLGSACNMAWLWLEKTWCNFQFRKILRFWQGAACVDSVVLVATYTCSGNKHKVRHFTKCFSWLCIELNCETEFIELARVQGLSVPCYASNQRVHFPLSLPKRTNEFSNQTCVLIRSTCQTLSLNKNFWSKFDTPIFIASVYSPIKESTENITESIFKTSRVRLLYRNFRSSNHELKSWVDNHAKCMLSGCY